MLGILYRHAVFQRRGGGRRGRPAGERYTVNYLLSYFWIRRVIWVGLGLMMRIRTIRFYPLSRASTAILTLSIIEGTGEAGYYLSWRQQQVVLENTRPQSVVQWYTNLWSQRMVGTTGDNIHATVGSIPITWKPHHRLVGYLRWRHLISTTGGEC